MNSFDLVIDFKNTLNLNDKLSELVTSLSSIGFENKVTMPNLALFTKDNIHAIMITQQQYSYKINGDFAVENFSEIIEDISSTINKAYVGKEDNSWIVANDKAVFTFDILGKVLSTREPKYYAENENWKNGVLFREIQYLPKMNNQL